MVDINEETSTKALINALGNPEVIAKLKSSQTEVSKKLDSLKTVIDNQAQLITKLSNENISSKSQIRGFKTKIEILENEIDSLEQYSRRNSIRISGINEIEFENIYEVVIDLLNNKIGLDEDIELADIDRAHRVGSSRTKNRPILVKFMSYQTRQLVFRARRKLRDDPELEPLNIYINEDLTRLRDELLFKARQLRNRGMVSECWTYDGRVLIKTRQGKVKPVANEAALNEFISKSPITNTGIPPLMASSPPIDIPAGATQVPVSPSHVDLPVQPLSSELVLKATPSTKFINNGKAICFLSEEAPLSNWYAAQMQIDDVSYCHIEQFFFADKAKTAEKTDILNKIMSLTDPSEIKKIGDRLKVDADKFDAVAVMEKAINAKFDQNTSLKQYLLDTKDAELCEASNNQFWGIGVYIKSRDLYKVEKWSDNKLGKNTLGKLLMKKRSQLQSAR
jgi:exosome complex exonuclease DIS3/RRP44